MTFGPPECAESDSGSNLLKNSRVRELCTFFGVRTRVSVGYCHQAVGKVERRHLDIKRRLRALSSSYGTDWELLLPGILVVTNNEPCRTHGFSPFFLCFLRYPHSSLTDLVKRPVRRYSDDFVSERLRKLSEVFQRARERQSERMAEYKRYHDRRHRAREEEYRPGDRVWCKSSFFSFFEKGGSVGYSLCCGARSAGLTLAGSRDRPGRVGGCWVPGRQ